MCKVFRRDFEVKLTAEPKRSFTGELGMTNLGRIRLGRSDQLHGELREPTVHTQVVGYAFLNLPCLTRVTQACSHLMSLG